MTSAYTYGADGLRRSITANGLRRSITANGVTTYYVYDGTMMVREMRQNAQGQLAPTATYLQGASGPLYRRDDTQSEGTYTNGAGQTLPAGRTRWYVYDGLGSVVGEVDPSGNLTSSGTFDVYGAKRAGGTGAATSRQGFVGALGHVTDTETGLIYMQARYYDPQAGRFISEDPNRSGRNWFAYCGNNPVDQVDADGKEPLGVTAWLSALGAIGNVFLDSFKNPFVRTMLAGWILAFEADLACLILHGVTGLPVGLGEIGAVAAMVMALIGPTQQIASAAMSGTLEGQVLQFGQDYGKLLIVSMLIIYADV